MLPEPDYENCSIDELIDVYQHIDRKKYPDRFKKVALLLGEYVEDCDNAPTSDDVNVLRERPLKIKDSPEIAEMKKMRRIEEFFDSLSEYGSEFHSDSFGSDCSGGDVGGDGD